MKISYIILTIVLLSGTLEVYPQSKKSDANIFGHIISIENNEHISFASIGVEGTTIGTTTDETGHFQLLNLPTGEHKLVASFLGYKPQTKVLVLKAGETREINFILECDKLGLEEVVVTGDRNKTNRKNSSTIVNTVTPKLFNLTQSVTLSEGLNFSPGLRMENNCQNCGFSQIRMNGMEGPYSQILINSRPIFSGLAGVYGLELIPASMIERVEIIRGGGSALYGSNAIAGTINLILKDPINNSYEFGSSASMIGGSPSGKMTSDYSVNFNTSIVSSDNKTGMSLYGFYRDRNPYDTNGDGFSEISLMQNNTIGTRLYHRFGARSKISLDFFNINEERRGGDKFDYPVHEANIAEAVDHNITTGAITYDKFLRENDLFSLYLSAQNVGRDSYYGAKKSMSDYGYTSNLTYTTGMQYSARFQNANLIAGLELKGDWLKDTKLGYPVYDSLDIDPDNYFVHTENTIIADQKIRTTGTFIQYDYTKNRVKISTGLRYDNYQINDRQNEYANTSGNILSPRIALKYDVSEALQGRISYSQGYRAPQIFDEDLHIETSGSRRIIHINSPDLQEELSRSYMLSLDFRKQINKTSTGLLIEAFYTKLEHPFANTYSLPDENGEVRYTRINAVNGAQVRGINMELNLVPSNQVSMKSGFTIQKSSYTDPQEFDEKTFFRTPQDYGYFTFDWTPSKKFGLSSTGNYTGKMLIPYFGEQLYNNSIEIETGTENEAEIGNEVAASNGELRLSDRFFDLGLKVRYNMKLNGATLQVYSGIKNIFNSYQTDFDYGIDRDPGYVYGPMNPRTIYVGLKIGNFLR